MAEENFYIGIQNPDEIRRYLLESSKEMITTLKKYEEFKRTRMEKAELVAKFNQIMKQINILANRLKKQFPEAGIRVPTLNIQEEAKAAKTREMKTRMPERAERKKEALSELEKLEEELKGIERKLNNL
jgi:hypothetical protein